MQYDLNARVNNLIQAGNRPAKSPLPEQNDYTGGTRGVRRASPVPQETFAPSASGKATPQLLEGDISV